jgi:arylsulfatase A-like enzyme
VKNLLLVSIEDLNDWIEPLAGHPDAVTPNLKRLAAMGAVFQHAYAAAPACSPSRTAALFSRYPWETGVYGNSDRWFDYFPVGGKQSLIGRLNDAGMTTLGCGKVFHSSYRANEESSSLDMGDWDDFYLAPKVKYPAISKSVLSRDLARNADFGIDPTGTPSYDDLNTDWICERIQPGAQGQAWALGIYRPHLPFVAPKEFFDLIPEKVSLPPGLGANAFDPDNHHLIEALPESAGRMARKQTKTGRILHEHGEYNQFLRAYLASIAYADSKLGQVLDRIEECGLLDDTIIVLWSDHGWQLGEKLAFRKFTLWERALRVPLMFAGPGLRKGDIRQPASLVDLAPTILSLLGIAPAEDYSGQDLSPALLDGGTLARPYAPSSWGVGFKDLRKLKLAYSARSERYRLTQYWDGAYELYDHSADPFEHTNRAGADFDPNGSGVPAEIRDLAADISSIREASVAPLDVQRGRRKGGKANTDDDEDDED